MMARCVYGRYHSDFNSDNSSSILIKYLFSMPSSSELCVCVRLPLDVLAASIQYRFLCSPFDIIVLASGLAVALFCASRSRFAASTETEMRRKVHPYLRST